MKTLNEVIEGLIKFRDEAECGDLPFALLTNKETYDGSGVIKAYTDFQLAEVKFGNDNYITITDLFIEYKGTEVDE